MGERRLAACAVLVLSVLALLGCGGGGDDGAAADERDSDAEIVNVSIGQELTLIQAYTRSMPFLAKAEARQAARVFRAKEHEHVNALTKALRGLGRDFEAESTEVDFSEVRSERDALLLLYAMTSAQLPSQLEDVPHLSTAAPQSFAAAIAANQAQHLVVLRRLLGAGLQGSVPDAFDTGEVPPPGERR